MRILVVEDDIDLARHLAKALNENGFAADVAADGDEGLFLGETESYDSVILDLGLPKMDGLSVLRHWREMGRTMPVLILTVRHTWAEKVAGFEAGCDDYVSKPFHVEEVLARIKALIRRAAGHSKPVLECGAVRLDTRTSHVSTGGTPVELTACEMKILSYLMHHKETIVSRRELSDHIYEYDLDRDSNTIEVFIARLRKKLGADLIQTCRGQGYRLAMSENAS